MFFLTADQGIFIGKISWLFGKLMNLIYLGLEKIGIERGAIGIAIIIFTLITRLILYPFTVQQQKSSKIMTIIQPEIKLIQKKYEGKQDQQSMMQQQAEMRAVYEKYGTSMTGSCVQLLIQMPIIFALYRVIMNIPAYVDKIKDHFLTIVTAMVSDKGSVSNVCTEIWKFATNEANKKTFSQAISTAKNFGIDTKTGEIAANITNTQQTDYIIDFLYKLSPSQLEIIKQQFSSSVQNIIVTEEKTINSLNSFCYLNLATAPSEHGFTIAPPFYILVPILAGLSQYLSVVLMQKQQRNPNVTQDENDQMAQTMKSMNIMMPLMSVVFCWGFATGIGVYWIASSVFMLLSQLIINDQLKNINVDDLIKKNIEKANKKRAKKGLPPLREVAMTNNLKRMEEQAEKATKTRENLVNSQKEHINDADKFYFEGENKDSLFAKANMVQKYNEKHNK